MKSAYILVGVLLAAVLLVSGCAQSSNQQPQPTGVVKTVEITAAGFSPGTLTINAGDAVMFVNKDTMPHRPASAQHPTHNAYPEPGGCTGSKFDACKGLAQDESWSFTFYQVGEWKYHDHLNCCTNPAFFGTIIVQ